MVLVTGTLSTFVGEVFTPIIQTTTLQRLEKWILDCSSILIFCVCYHYGNVGLVRPSTNKLHHFEEEEEEKIEQILHVKCDP